MFTGAQTRNQAIAPDGSKDNHRASQRKHACRTSPASLNMTAVTTKACPKSPQSHHAEWLQKHLQLLGYGSKSKEGCLDLLHPNQLLSHLAAVTAVVRMAPHYHRAVQQDGSESTIICLDLGWSQVTTEPLSRMAAKARSVAWTCRTSANCSCTRLLSPP